MLLKSIIGPEGQTLWTSDRFTGVHHDQFHLQQSRVYFKPGVHIINSSLLDDCLIAYNDAGKTRFHGVAPLSVQEFLA